MRILEKISYRLTKLDYQTDLKNLFQNSPTVLNIRSLVSSHVITEVKGPRLITPKS